MKNTLITKNVTIRGSRTSLRLEKDIWDALDDIREREDLTIHELCTVIEDHRHGSSRTSAVRAFVVAYFRAVANGVDENETVPVIDLPASVAPRGPLSGVMRFALGRR